MRKKKQPLEQLTPEDIKKLEKARLEEHVRGELGMTANTETAIMPDKNYPPDWTKPSPDDTIEVPDELMPLLNQVGMQLRLHTISKKNEVLTCAHIVYNAQKFFLKDTLAFAEWLDHASARIGEHEWKYRGDNYKASFSTQQMYEFYHEIKNPKP